MSHHHVAATRPTGEPASAAPAETGHERVDAVVRSLDSLDGRPAEEHVPVFEAAHRDLRDALSSPDQPA